MQNFQHDELIERCRQGDGKAFHALYNLYIKAMYNVSCRIVGNTEDAQDVVQDSFISAYKNIHRYRSDATFGAWLKRIVINHSINFLRMRKSELFPDDESFDVPEGEQIEPYREELSIEKVRLAIERLPDGYRTVLSLYLLEGYDHQEIGGILGISESTSKSQLNRAKASLKNSLLN